VFIIILLTYLFYSAFISYFLLYNSDLLQLTYIIMLNICVILLGICHFYPVYIIFTGLNHFALNK
jgi:hypothetical protein